MANRCKRCGTKLVIPATGRRPLYCRTACRVAAAYRRRKRLIHFKSDSVEWSTPQSYFDDQNARFGGFTLDACATAENAKCERFYTQEQDGLAQPWTGRVWCNPPYGRGVGHWLQKAWQATSSGEADVVVCLVPARTDTRWWHEWSPRASSVEFAQGRLAFGGQNSAPFPSVLLVFRKAHLPYETTDLAPPSTPR